jgi:hypothetical protein
MTRAAAIEMAKLPFDVRGFVLPELPSADVVRTLSGGFAFPGPPISTRAEEWGEANIAGWEQMPASDKAAFVAAFSAHGSQPFNDQLTDYIARGGAPRRFLPDLGKLPSLDRPGIPSWVPFANVPFVARAESILNTPLSDTQPWVAYQGAKASTQTDRPLQSS